MNLAWQENVPLAAYTTFKVGGSARYFAVVKTIEELRAALSLAAEKNLPILIMAGGSNLIISSKGFDGLVIFVQFGGVKIEDDILTAGAAATMEKLVDSAISKSLAGLEWAGGLPGTFGGAIRGNAGAFGGEIKDAVARVTTVNFHTGALKNWTNNDCQFGYRDSIFKQEPSEVIVLARLQLAHGDGAELRHIADEHIRYRQERHPLEYPNSGSIFKNVPVENVPPETRKIFEASVKTDPFPVIPTARIIADASLKGVRVGDAQVSEKHSNYIVNLGAATGEDIVALIKKVQNVVQEKFSIKLEVEPELVGF